MAWFRRKKNVTQEKKVKIPEGLWVKCDNCKEIVYRKEIEKNRQVCPKCGYHFRISSRQRLRMLSDDGSFVELDADLMTTDPLEFMDSMPYAERIEENRAKSGLSEAALYGDASISGRPVVLALMDFSFMGGSMGSVVGEKISRAAERAIEKKVPLITIAASGGARMQEGMLSLMQMAKVSASIGRLRESEVLYISVLADPTFGGVTASFAMLGDVIIAEPRSLVGFAGPRVIEQTIKQQLPDNFQRAEFLLEHGMIDLVVERQALKETLARLIHHFMPLPAVG
ncbi:MAG TPA: acetyl-CoA carboxylase, carboxyltransferase subunit beta [Dissulfurispiraceae bacterium]|nr:acetyl-CoA carboxylase, carboxyltransferase subunit beta [Dissulfurispiraceae bacterium]